MAAKRKSRATGSRKKARTTGWSAGSSGSSRPVKFKNARIGGFLGIELKFLDCAWNSVTVASSVAGADGEMQPSSGCTDCISAPVQGDGEQQRDGRRYNLKSCHISGILQTTAEANQPDANEVFGHYVALVLDKQANAATITSENVFINPSTLAAAMLPYPLRNLQNTRRFRILDSKYIHPGGAYSVPDGTNTGSISNQNAQKFSLSWSGNLPVDAVGTTADVASVSNNALHLVAYTGSLGQTVTFIGKSRVRFVG